MNLLEFITHYYGNKKKLSESLDVSLQSVYNFIDDPTQMYKHLKALKKKTGLSADEIIKILDNE